MASVNFRGASVVLENGKLFTWARDRHPETEDESDDTGESRFFMTVLSSDASASVSDSGDLYVRGDNPYGMLGVGDIHRVWSLMRVPRTLFGGKSVQQVGLGTYHTIALASGSVFTAGCGASVALCSRVSRDCRPRYRCRSATASASQLSLPRASCTCGMRTKTP